MRQLRGSTEKIRSARRWSYPSATAGAGRSVLTRDQALVFQIVNIIVVSIFPDRLVDNAADNKTCDNRAHVYFTMIALVSANTGMRTSIAEPPVMPRHMVSAHEMPPRCSMVASRIAA